jgi:hypothetical protein
MSDTPRTDKATRMAFSGEYMVEIEEAQKMERELADMTKQINPYEREAAKAAINALKRELAEVTKQRDHYKKACDQYSEDEMLCKLAEVTKQRDALAEALERWSIIREWLEMDVYIKGYMSNEKDFFDGLDKTLAATKGRSQTSPCKDDLIDACNALLQSEEVQKAWPLDGTRKAEKPNDTFSRATATVKFRKLLAIHSALQAVKGGQHEKYTNNR